MKEPGAIAGWTVSALVTVSILTAWMDSAAEHFCRAAILTVGGVYVLCGATAPLRSRLGSAWRLGSALEERYGWLALIPALCAAWAAIQILAGWAVSPYDTWNAASGWLACAVVFSLARSGFQSSARREKLATGIVYFGGGYGLLGLLGWYSGGGSVLWLFDSGYQNEVAGTFANRDQYAVLIELLLPFALIRALRRSDAAAVGCAAVMFASVIASASRAGTLIAIGEVVVVLALCWREARRPAVLLTAALAICTAAGGWTYVLERFAAPDPFAARREMLEATVSMIRVRPVTGFGFGAWPCVYPQFAVFDPPGVYMNHAHNDWAEWAADGGLPAAVLLGVFAVSSALLARRRPWALGTVAVLVHALVDFPLHKPALIYTLMFVTGLAAASVSARQAGEFHSCGRLRR